jgi:hypothetical protein
MSREHPLFTEKQHVSESPNGAFAIGYGSHFGLGLFLPIKDGGAVQPTQGDSKESVRNQSKI